MSSLPRLNPYLWKYRRLLIPGLIFTMISACFGVAVPMIVRQVVDAIPRMVTTYRFTAGTDITTDLYTGFFAALCLYGFTILGLSLLAGLFSFLTRQTVVVSSRHIEYDLRNALFEHLQRLSGHFFQRMSTGDVIARSTSDIEQVRRYVGPALMYATRSIVTTVMVLTVMFVISPSLTLWALTPMPVLAIAIFFMARMIHRRSDALQAQYAQLTGRVQEALSGIRVIKAYTREDYEASAFDEESSVYRDRALSLARVEAAFRPVFILIIGLSVIVIVWIGGLQVMQGSITVGNIAEYIIYVMIMTWPVAALGFVLNMIQRADASMGRLCEVLDTEPKIADSSSTDKTINEIKGHVVFDDVSFVYDDASHSALRDVSFDLPTGKTLGIVGRTGSGKSTLIRLILRLIEPTSGEIRIDDSRIAAIPVQVLRAGVGYVPQEAFLFSDTVAENIAFGRPNATFEEIRSASDEADLLSNIDGFPNGFDTKVGERGVTLSGGQKQRAAIARALIRRPSILILDDSLSAVDTATESRILNRLRDHFGQRTVVIVSHRISAVQGADQIIVLDDGKIIDRGNHEELLSREGLYSELARRQHLEQEIEAL